VRIAFMGTPDFAAPVLAELIGLGHDIACVYSQPPRPKGRGLSEEVSPVHALAVSSNMPVRTPVTLKDPVQSEIFESLDLDATVVVAYGLLLPPEILETPALGCFNLHASLLPRWRGAAPIQRAIMAGDAETGVMVMRMEESLDTGPVLMAERVKIGRKTYGELHDELSRLGANLMGRALSALDRGSITAMPQGKEGVTHAKKIAREETRLDWTRPAAELDRLIRGLSPAPGAWFEAKGERIKVLLAEPVSGSGAQGEVIAPLTIACGEGALKFLSLQRAGKAVMKADDFARGFTLAVGEKLD
jgi:methionyl-tRNA formyltransferase